MTDEERIYDIEKMKQLPVYPTKQTPSYADWNLFEMGKDLEDSFDTAIADVYTKDEIDTKVGSLAKDDLSNVDLGSENAGKSLIVDSEGGIELDTCAKDDLSNVDFGSENVGKSLMVDSDGAIELGNPSFTPGSSGVVVPDTPATIHDAVNQAYVESTVDGVNNLVHKSANETIYGSKDFIDPIQGMLTRIVYIWNTNTPDGSYMPVVKFKGVGRHSIISLIADSNNGSGLVKLLISTGNVDGIVVGGVYLVEKAGNQTGSHIHAQVQGIKVCTDANGITTLYLKRNGVYGAVLLNIDMSLNYGAPNSYHSNMEFFDVTDATLPKTLAELETMYTTVTDVIE